jgi:hypothetical protein
MAAASGSSRRPINLLRGWPSPDMLPVRALNAATEKVLSDPTIFVPGLQYAPDAGYQPLREELARWLSGYFNVNAADPERICISGGASQSIANILQSYTDPVYTKAIWMVAPCYYLACPIFADSCFRGRMKAVPEDDEGIDLVVLERGLESMKGDDGSDKPVGPILASHRGRGSSQPSFEVCCAGSGRAWYYRLTDKHRRISATPTRSRIDMSYTLCQLAPTRRVKQ